MATLMRCIPCWDRSVNPIGRLVGTGDCRRRWTDPRVRLRVRTTDDDRGETVWLLRLDRRVAGSGTCVALRGRPGGDGHCRGPLGSRTISGSNHLLDRRVPRKRESLRRQLHQGAVWVIDQRLAAAVNLHLALVDTHHPASTLAVFTGRVVLANGHPRAGIRRASGPACCHPTGRSWSTSRRSASKWSCE